MHSPNSSARVILQGGGEGRNTNHTLTHGSVTSRHKCHGHLCSKSRTPTAAPQRLVQYVLMEQPSGSVGNALPLTFQAEPTGSEKLKLGFQMRGLKLQ